MRNFLRESLPEIVSSAGEHQLPRDLRRWKAKQPLSTVVVVLVAATMHHCEDASVVVPAAVTAFVFHGVSLWNPSCTSGVLGQVRVPSDHEAAAILLRQPRQ